MAKVYSWAVSETQYAYIIHPNDIDKDSPRAYVGTELKGNNLQKVVDWVQSCENSEYESQFEKMLALCESKNINVKFENVASYMNIESSCDNLRGPAGKGIKSLVFEKSDSITNIDTYVIYYTDGTTDKFTIKQGINGRDGRDGKDGARGASGERGFDGLPGTSLNILYCLGDEINPFANNTEWQENLTELTGWSDIVISPNPIDIEDSTLIENPEFLSENVGKMVHLKTTKEENNNIEIIHKHFYISESKGAEPKSTEENYVAYIWAIQGTDIWERKDNIDTKIGVKWTAPFKLQGTNGIRGVAGADGNRGQVVYPMGVYNPETTYVTTEAKAPYVFDNGSYYVLDKIGKWKGSENNYTTPSQDYENAINSNIKPTWQKFEGFEAIFTKIGIIANGMVGSAVFNNEFMFSQQGIDKEGNKTDYAIESGDNPSGNSGFLSGYEFDEVEKKWKYVGTDDYIKDIDVNPYEEKDGTPIHSFRPNVCINFATGQMWLSNGKAVFGQTETNVATTNDMIDAIDGLLKTKVNGGLNLIGRIELDVNKDEYFEFIESLNEKLYDEKIFRLKRLKEESELEGVIIKSDFLIENIESEETPKENIESEETPKKIVLPVEVGKEYVISVYVKNQSTVDDEEIFGGIGIYTYNTSTSEWKLLGNPSILSNKTDLWQQISYVFKPEDETLEYYPVLYSYNTTSDDAYLYYSCLKLQEGNIATVGFEAITEDKVKNQKEIDEAKEDAVDIAKGIMALNSNLTLALEDGYLSIEEQNLLKESLSNIDKEMTSLDKEHKDVSKSNFLTEEQKIALNDAKKNIDTAYEVYKKQLEILTNIKFKIN